MNSSGWVRPTVERGFESLLTDPIALARRAEATHNAEHAATFARASIIASALYLEACANCCLDLLAMNRQFADDVDRLPTATKFDLFLRLRGGSGLDRSRSEYQGYAEVKLLRDSFVHQRAQKVVLDRWTEEDHESSSPRTKALGLVKIPAFCCDEDAVSALRAAHAFAKYFFSDCAHFSTAEVGALLYSEVEVPDLSYEMAPLWPRSIRRWLESRAISLSYMHILWR